MCGTIGAFLLTGKILPDFRMLLALMGFSSLQLRQVDRLSVDKIDLHTNVPSCDGCKGHYGVIKPQVVLVGRPLRGPLSVFRAGDMAVDSQGNGA